MSDEKWKASIGIGYVKACQKNEPLPVRPELGGCAKDMPKVTDFYIGVEWLGAWLVDHCEGETVSEELVIKWCGEAWASHILRHNRVIDGKGDGMSDQSAKPDYIKEHLRLVTIEVEAKQERLGKWTKEEG